MVGHLGDKANVSQALRHRDRAGWNGNPSAADESPDPWNMVLQVFQIDET